MSPQALLTGLESVEGQRPWLLTPEAISTRATTRKRPAGADTTLKMITPTCKQCLRADDRIVRRPGAHARVDLAERFEAPGFAIAGSRPRRGRRRDSHCPRSRSARRRSRPAELSRNRANAPERPQGPTRRTSEAVSRS